MGNINNMIRPIEGLLPHIRSAITEMASIENAAREQIAFRLRMADWTSDVDVGTIIKNSFDGAAGEVDKSKWSGIASSLCVAEYERILHGEIQALVKNNFVRVLVKRFRRLINEPHAKLRPLYNLVKLVLGPMGNWAKGNVYKIFIINF